MAFKNIKTPEMLEQERIISGIATTESAINSLIQSEVTKYNTTAGVAFRDIYSCGNYRHDTGYAHQPFCTAVWAWNVGVWETARQIQLDYLAGTRPEPNLDEVLAELPVMVWP